MSGWAPTDVVNQSLDAVGADVVLGDIEDGTREGNIALRAYRQCLMQLLRGANWDFARATVDLVMLGDATGQTPGTVPLVPVNWTYAYAYPIDCMKVRFLPWNYRQANPAAPAGNYVEPPAANGSYSLPGQNLAPFFGQPYRPARFVIATSSDYPVPQGAITWEVQGISPTGRTVILTNVKCSKVVYTQLKLYPSEWDSLFRAALVAYIASEIALPIWSRKNPKIGLTLRAQQIGITKEKLIEARRVDGNEGFSSSDIAVDWLNARRVGGRGFGNGDLGNGGYGFGAGGTIGAGFDTIGFSDGTAY